MRRYISIATATGAGAALLLWKPIEPLSEPSPRYAPTHDKNCQSSVRTINLDDKVSPFIRRVCCPVHGDLISVPVSDHHHMCPHTLLCITKQKVDRQLFIFVGQFQTLR